MIDTSFRTSVWKHCNNRSTMSCTHHSRISTWYVFIKCFFIQLPSWFKTFQSYSLKSIEITLDRECNFNRLIDSTTEYTNESRWANKPYEFISSKGLGVSGQVKQIHFSSILCSSLSQTAVADQTDIVKQICGTCTSKARDNFLIIIDFLPLIDSLQSRQQTILFAVVFKLLQITFVSNNHF